MADSKATRTAYAALTKFTDVQEGEDVLIITDETGMEENGEIVTSMFGIAKQLGANPTTIVMEDADPGASQAYLPEAAKEGMKSTDVLIGITKTTIASVTHHELPDRLRENGELRSLVMAKRSYETLTSRFTLEADYERILEIQEIFAELFNDATEVRLTSESGMDVTMRVDAHPRAHKGDFATERGGFTTMTWGEYGQAPNAGTANVTFVIDGPVLEYGWPSPPLEVEVEDGQVTDIYGDTKMARQLTTLIEENENADNIAEMALGTNPIQSSSRDPNIVKKMLGTAHTAIGSGQAYGQDVDSPVHLDLIMTAPSVELDGKQILDEGELVLDI